VLTNVTLSGNSVPFQGGGIYNYSSIITSTAILTNVTLSGNTAPYYGGGIINYYGTVALINVTFSGNSATHGGGIYHTGRSLVLKNTIMANSPMSENCAQAPGSVTTIVSNGFNLSSDTSCAAFLDQSGDRNNQLPMLGPLANNGGFTRTHFPQLGSPAIDNGQCIPGLTTDQRGASRPVGLSCDIGAVEVGVLMPRVYVPLVIHR
jgi:predicted outer membrane repeat protein